MRSLAHTNASGRADFSRQGVAVGGILTPRLADRGVRSRMHDGVTESRGPRVHGRCGAGQPEKDHAPASPREQVGRDERAGAAIVERDEVVVSGASDMARSTDRAAPAESPRQPAFPRHAD